MEIKEEIKKLQQLQSEGAILNEEYLILTEKLNPKSDKGVILTEKVNKSSNSYDSSAKQNDQSENTTINFGQKVVVDSDKLQNEEKIFLAGVKLKSSAMAQVWSKILGTFSVLCFLIVLKSSMAQGLFVRFDTHGSPILALMGLFALASVFFWISSVSTMYDAGKILKDFKTNKL